MGDHESAEPEQAQFKEEYCMNKTIHTEEVKRHIQCCIDTDECILCSFFKEGCDKGTFAKLMLTAMKQLERERDAAVEDLKEHGAYCSVCLHNEKLICEEPCITCSKLSTANEHINWQWRGVEVE